MTGKYQLLFSKQIQHVLIVGGDMHACASIKTQLASILQTSQIDLLDPLDDAMNFAGHADLLVFVIDKEWRDVNAWLSVQSPATLPAIIVIDFDASIAAAVEMMRMGAVDYINNAELNENHLIGTLSLVTGNKLLSDDHSSSDRTEVSPYLSAADLEERDIDNNIPDITPINTDILPDKTEVMPQVEKADIEKTEVMPQVAKADIEKTEVMPQVAKADIEKTEVMPQVAKADIEKTEVMPQVAKADIEKTEVMPQVAKADIEKADKVPDVPTKTGDEKNVVKGADERETTNVLSQVIQNRAKISDDDDATDRIDNDAFLKLQQTHREEVERAKPEAGKSKANDFEVGPHTEVAPHIQHTPGKGQFEVKKAVQPEKNKTVKDDAPFSGAWLRMPEVVGEKAWPFSAEDMESGKATLGGYRVLEFLGVGGMASVFKVQRMSDDQLFAIKLLDPTMADDKVRERFIREFNMLKTIQHKHVVRMEEQVEDGESLFTVMEYLPGGDLKSRIRRRLKRDDAVRYAAQIAAALQAAHKRGVLHRDLKPANVLFRANGNLALVDFGVAKDTSGRDKALTEEGQMVGTPYYASPEQATGAVIDQRSDLYALGVIMFEMLEGRRPFVGDTSLQVLMAHVKDPIPLLSHDWDILNDVLAHLLAKDPADRLPDGQAVVRALNEASPGDVPEGLLEE